MQAGSPRGEAEDTPFETLEGALSAILALPSQVRAPPSPFLPPPHTYVHAMHAA